MNFKLTIMGTASAMPISDRNPSAQMLDVHGRLFLIDCGEGTQKAIRQARLSFVKIDCIFISHIHGDHVFGIFGILSTIGLYGRTEELTIYAPKSFGPILKFFLSYFGEAVAYPIVHKPIDVKEPGVILDSRYVSVTAFPLNHKIECFGFRFDEKVPERRPSNEPFKAHSYAYCSDTAPFDKLPDYVRGVDVLYHEATYVSGMEDKAEKYYHSTSQQAAQCALEAGVGKLILGHYSSRVRDNRLFEEEARKIFPDSFASNEGDVYDIC